MKHRCSTHCIVTAALLTSLLVSTSCSKKPTAQLGVDGGPAASADAGVAPQLDAGVVPQLDAGVAPHAREVNVPDDILMVEQSPPGAWQKVRDQALKNLVKLAGHGDPRRLGFETPPALSSLKVLDPIPNALVRFADVQNYQDTKNPATLVKVDERLTFPILSGKKVVSAITLTKVGNGWKIVSYGEPRTIRAVMNARILAVRPTVGAPFVKPGKTANYRIISVTGLNEWFLAAEGLTGTLYFIPLYDRPRLGFTAGAPLSAKDVLLKLRPLAIADAGVLPAPPTP